MEVSALLSWSLALVPVLLMTAAFVWLDVFKLVTRTEIIVLLVLGGLAAVAAYPVSGIFLDTLPIGFSNYSRFAAPWIEEALKAIVVIGLFWFNRIGLKLDAVIMGFAIGAGFSVVENVIYLVRFDQLPPTVWMVRGVGTAIMHGTTADSDKSLHVEPLYADPMVAALPHAHRLAGRTRLALADLAAEPFVLVQRPAAPELFDALVARCREAGFSPRVVQDAAGWHTIAGLVAAGVGVAFVPRSLAQHARPRVAYRPVRDLGVELSMVVAWRKGRQSPVRERFVTSLRVVARARPRPDGRAKPAAASAASKPASG